MRITGQYETLGSLSHFTPNPLAPKEPSFKMDHSLIDLYEKAMHHLGRLNEMARRVPNIQRFIRAYITKEAMQSITLLLTEFDFRVILRDGFVFTSKP